MLSTTVEKPTEANQYAIITTLSGPFGIEALDDRLIIQEDKYKTGFECKGCQGEGFVDIDCTMCVGQGKPAGYEAINDDRTGVPCRLCSSKGRGQWDIIGGKGKKTCPDCNGIGASIVVPQESERRPTSGIIHSIGPDVKNPKLKPGVRVLYAIFAGVAIDFKSRGVCRIMHENEIMTIIYGTANLGDIVR